MKLTSAHCAASPLAKRARSVKSTVYIRTLRPKRSTAGHQNRLLCDLKLISTSPNAQIPRVGSCLATIVKVSLLLILIYASCWVFATRSRKTRLLLNWGLLRVMDIFWEMWRCIRSHLSHLIKKIYQKWCPPLATACKGL